MMKAINHKTLLFCVLGIFFFLNTHTLSAQWVYGSSSTTNSIYRWGKVGIRGYPAYNFDVKGTIRCWTLRTTSDKSYKKDIKDLVSPLSTIDQLQGVTYEFDTSKQKEGVPFPKGRNIGLIAQDVEKVVPELVSVDDEGIRSVNYIGIIPILIEATKELNQKLVDKEKELSLYEERIKKLEQQMAALSKSVSVEKLDNYSLGQNIPNPARNNTKVNYTTPLDAKNVALKIFSTEGKLIWQKKVKPSLSGEVVIPTHDLKKEMYIYALTVSDKIIASKKLIVN